MIARAAGGTILALAVILYFVGPFHNDFDSFIALVVAGAFGALLAWLTRERKSATEPGVFDERATRRAVRRGVLRTALVAIVWVVVAATVFSGVSTAVQNRGDRGDHLVDVLGYGFFVGHAGFEQPFEGRGTASHNTGLRSIDIAVLAQPRTAQPLSQPFYVPLEVNLRGRLVEILNVPQTAVDVRADVNARTLERLPDLLVATAVVEFRSPLGVGDVYRLLARQGLDTFHSNTGLFLQQRDPEGGRRSREERVCWPNPNLAQFQVWVKGLRGSDDGLLSDLGVPPVSVLRAIAQNPRVYGVLLDDVSPRRLRVLLAEPAVASVAIGDVAFDVRGGSS